MNWIKIRPNPYYDDILINLDNVISISLSRNEYDEEVTVLTMVQGDRIYLDSNMISELEELIKRKAKNNGE